VETNEGGACYVVQKVEAFDVLAESDAKTEGQLRAKFDRAIACTPCVLLLKDVDALARKNQAVEMGQGASSLGAPSFVLNYPQST
jgi:AAA+ superfamily predicted ATPase